MCGIPEPCPAPAGAAPDPALLERMGRAIAHRGPDHFATWLAGPIGLAHNRLSLLDLSAAAHQPFLLEDHGDLHALVFNGELYNFRELRDGLLAAGAALRTSSDTEVLAAPARRATGLDETLRRVRGMFAFAWWQAGTRRLILARDRLGIKPLFYWPRRARHPLRLGNEGPAGGGRARNRPGAGFYSPLGLLEKARVAHRVPRHPPRRARLLRDPGARPAAPGPHLLPADRPDRRSRVPPARPSARLEPRCSTSWPGFSASSVDSMRVADAPMGAFVSGGIDSGLIAARSA